MRPQFVDESAPAQLKIVQGRHPVLDVALDSPVVPNDTQLMAGGPCALVITGPNMGGKSCYIRQAALIAIMAQVLQCTGHTLSLMYFGCTRFVQNRATVPQKTCCGKSVWPKTPRIAVLEDTRKKSMTLACFRSSHSVLCCAVRCCFFSMQCYLKAASKVCWQREYKLLQALLTVFHPAASLAA